MPTAVGGCFVSGKNRQGLVSVLFCLLLLVALPAVYRISASTAPPNMPGTGIVSEAKFAGASAPKAPGIRCLYYERELFLAAMTSPRVYEAEGELVAGMVPHHLLASDIIAGFFNLAAKNKNSYDSVLIISPSHFPENCGENIVTAKAGWDTPYGGIECDADTAGAILANPDLNAEDNPAAMEADHGAAGLAPFVRYCLPGVKLSAVLVSNKISREELKAFWEAVNGICESKRILLVASVDCSHYLTPEEAALRDRETAAAIEAGDMNRILSFGDGNLDSPQAVTAFLEAAKARDAELKLLERSSSEKKLPYAAANPVYRDGVTTYLAYAAAVKPKEAAIAVAGDIMVHDFSKDINGITGADYTVGNLETVLAGEAPGYYGEILEAGVPRFNAPDSLAEKLKAAGFDMLCLANNHCLDQGEAGLLRTAETLKNAGLEYAGAGKTPVVTINGIRVAFCAFTYGTNNIPVPADKPWLVNPLTEENIVKTLNAAKAESPDYIIALPHMGAEYSKSPAAHTRAVAGLLIRYGADAVLASHPHVVQQTELLKTGPGREGLVCWSLGNYISSQRRPGTDTGAVVTLHLKKSQNGQTVLEKTEVSPIRAWH